MGFLSKMGIINGKSVAAWVLMAMTGVLMFAGGIQAGAVTAPTATITISITKTTPASGNVVSGSAAEFSASYVIGSTGATITGLTLTPGTTNLAAGGLAIAGGTAGTLTLDGNNLTIPVTGAVANTPIVFTAAGSLTPTGSATWEINDGDWVASGKYCGTYNSASLLTENDDALSAVNGKCAYPFTPAAVTPTLASAYSFPVDGPSTIAVSGGTGLSSLSVDNPIAAGGITITFTLSTSEGAQFASKTETNSAAFDAAFKFAAISAVDGLTQTITRVSTTVVKNVITGKPSDEATSAALTYASIAATSGVWVAANQPTNAITPTAATAINFAVGPYVPPPPLDLPSTKNDGKIYQDATIPVGDIILIANPVTFDPSSGDLKISTRDWSFGLPDRDGKASKASDYVWHSITYTPKSTAPGAGGPITYEYTINNGTATAFSDKGVRYEENPAYDPANPVAGVNRYVATRKLVAQDYDVVVKVARKQDPTIVVGISKTITFTVNRKPLSGSMVNTDFLTSDEEKYSGKSKDPRVKLTDSKVLIGKYDETSYYDYSTNSDTWASNINVGTYNIVISGAGNYTGDVTKSYKITPATLDFASGAGYTFSKTYDGSNLVSSSDSADFEVKFSGYPSNGTELSKDDYVIATNSLKYADKNVGTGKVVNATITLGTTTAAKNYSLKTTGNNNFSFSGGVITKGTPTADLIDKLLSVTFDNPARKFELGSDNEALFNNTKKAVNVAWATGISNSGSKFIVKYDGDTTKPSEMGSYPVTVEITAGSNLEKSAEDIPLGTLAIVDGLPPVIDPESPKDTSYYSGGSVTLKVLATNPKDGKTTGLTYQWVQVTDTGSVVLKGKTQATLLVNEKYSATRPTVAYKVAVTYKGTEQVAKTDTSKLVTVTIYDEPKSIRGAVISVGTTYEYDGTEHKPATSEVNVTVGGNTLNPETDFVVTQWRNNTNAGEGLVTVKGLGAWKDTETGTFTITKKVPRVEELNIGYNVDYTGAAQDIRVSTIGKLSGLGAITRVYSPDSAARTDAGAWDVTISIAEGQNYEALEAQDLNQQFVIRKAVFDETLFEDADLPKTVVYDGTPKTIALPAKKGLGTFYTGDVTLVYSSNGDELSAAVEKGTYTVYARVAGDKNFVAVDVPLGVLTVGDVIAVKEVAREIPGKVTVEEAAVAPVKKVAAEVTVGPSPVVSGGAVTVYYNGNTTVTGKLSVFTSQGKKIATLNAKGTKNIGSWNTAGAAEGTYLIKGVLKAKDGAAVKVSLPVAVVK